MERGADSRVSERDAMLQLPAAHRRVKTEPGLEEEPTTEHFRMVQDSTYVPAGVCSPQASCALKQEIDIGPTVLQPTDLPYIKLEFDVPIKEEPFQMVQDSTYVPAGVCSPQASCAVKQEISVEPTVLQAIDLPFIKLESIKKEPLQMVQDSTYVPAGVCSPDAVCVLKQEMDIGPTVLQPTDLPFIKLESIKKEPLQVEIKSSDSMNETAISSNNIMKGHGVSVSRLQVKKKQPSEVCSEILPQNSSVLVVKQRNFKCDVCPKSYMYEGSLKSHMEIHTGARAFKCDVCLKIYTMKSKLKSHMEIHTGVRTFQCDVCFKSFRHKGHLNSHMAIHTGIRPYKCDICPKAYAQNSKLKSHMEIHTEVRAFKCDVCFKSFRVKGHLNSHVAIHNAVRAFKCDVCSKSFRSKGHLNIHTATHTNNRPFKCDICVKSYTQKGDLKSHMTIHTGVRAFKCEVCLKSFRLKGNLNSHMAIHTGIRPFKCNICLKTYTRKKYLKSHMVIHTGISPFKCDV